MIAEIAATRLLQPDAPTSRGMSATAEYVVQETERDRRHLQNSYTLGQRAKGSLNELYSVFETCRNRNWDGYGADAVSPDAFKAAYELLEALPLGTAAPSIGAEPDGYVTLEWHRSAHRTLSVSVGAEGAVHYAALVGGSKHYGTESFYGEAPKAIVDLIGAVMTA